MDLPAALEGRGDAFLCFGDACFYIINLRRMKLLEAVSLLPLLATLTHCSPAGAQNAQNSRESSPNFQSPPTLRYHHDYCVLGAGPAGLQIAHFLEKCGRDYVVLERNHAPGSFFQRYPRHRRLISINKIHTGRSNTEFNLRHDWNSLLSDRDSLRYKHYSKEYYPHADSMQEYLQQYSTELNLRVRYGTEILNVRRGEREGGRGEGEGAWHSHRFVLTDQDQNTYTCSVVLVATGLWVPKQVRFPGSEFLEGYESVSVDPEDFAGQAVLILGKGNSAFETAANLLGTAGHLHLYSRTPVRLAWETHYVGDLRAVNNDLLDSYQLKSLDGLVEGAVEQLAVLRDGRGRLYLTLAELLRASNVSRATAEALDMPTLMSLLPADQDDNFSLRRPYDRMVRCLGFEFDYSIFNNDTAPFPRRGPPRKYPLLTPWYETQRTPGIFVIGTASHGRDHRRSAGGFIHGFRYTVRAVHRVLEQRYHGNSWPSISLPTSQLLGAVLRRINEASGPYQMFSVLGDIVLLQGNGSWFQYIEEFPLQSLPALEPLSGLAVSPAGLLVITMQYGQNQTNPLGQNRAISDWREAWRSKFLHPVIYYYRTLPSASEMKLRPRGWPLPRPHALHHVVEDFLTEWSGAVSHIQPLRRFLEHCVSTELRNYYTESCFRLTLTNRSPPLSCRQGYLRKQGLVGNARLWRHAMEAGLMQDFLPEPAPSSQSPDTRPGFTDGTENLAETDLDAVPRGAVLSGCPPLLPPCPALPLSLRSTASLFQCSGPGRLL